MGCKKFCDPNLSALLKRPLLPNVFFTLSESLPIRHTFELMFQYPQMIEKRPFFIPSCKLVKFVFFLALSSFFEGRGENLTFGTLDYEEKHTVGWDKQ